MDRAHAGRNIAIETMEEIERDFEKELKDIEDKLVEERAGEASF